jgi:leader peptidase (prepilin peptidase)/N-methyltransferase
VEVSKNMDFILQKLPEIIVFFLFGSIFGSFATMASYRIPRDEDIVMRPSCCPKCNHRLGFLDLFPIFSWLFSGGKCRHCKSPVSCRYPLIELALSSLFVLIYLKIGANLEGFALCALAICLVIMITVDLEHQIIPDSIQLAMLITGIIYSYAIGIRWQECLGGAAVGLAVALSLRYGFWLYKKREGLGMGDVKFFAVAGLFLGIKAFAPFMFLSGIIGVTSGILWKKAGKGDEFPFGPALAIAMFLCLIIPEYTVNVIYWAR